MKADSQGQAASSMATRHFIVGTAGHIDHGKSSLVRALTGTDPDRLPEEKRRGMTIELGFAELSVGDTRFGMVDVPGHERFVRTMVAGATGIDMVLFVVAADDSVMPQTIEHAEILHLLGITHGVVAITKIDMVDRDLVELVIEDARRTLGGTRLAGAPICPVSSATGAGLEELKRSMVEVSTRIRPASPQPPFRMAIDRVFSVAGRGTVVTGSVLRGRVAEGDSLEVLPAGGSCRVRGLQTHGMSAVLLARGQRAAINIGGIEREQLQRGYELATPGYLRPTRMADVRLQCLASYDRPLTSASSARLEIGTTEVPVRVVLLDGVRLPPGQSALAQLRSGSPFAAAWGQHFILRDENAARTIGGGIILDPLPRRRKREPEIELQTLRRLEDTDLAARVEEVLRLAAFRPVTVLELCAHAGVEADAMAALLDQLRERERWTTIGGTDVAVVPEAMDDLGRRLSHWLGRYHKENTDSPGRPVESVLHWLERLTSKTLARPLFDEMVRRQTVKLVGRFVALPAFAPTLTASDERKLSALIEAIRAGGFQPPSIEELAGPVAADRKRSERLATLAVTMGELVPIAPPIYLHADAERQLREKVAGLIGQQGGVTVAAVREALDSSRKFVVPFLEYLDRVGFTRRVGDLRYLADRGHGRPIGR